MDIEGKSKIGSLDNVRHKPGGGDKKVFNDVDYLRQGLFETFDICHFKQGLFETYATLNKGYLRHVLL